jgi:O-antigen/teichoic acid export membrane protein
VRNGLRASTASSKLSHLCYRFDYFGKAASEESMRFGRRVLLANIFSGAGAQGLTAIAALWAIPQLLAATGADGYGTYSIATTIVGYFSIADLGLSNATLQELARARGARDTKLFGEVVGASAALLGGVAVLVACVLAAFARPIGEVLAGATATEAQRATVIAATRWCAIGAIPTLLRPVLEAIVAAAEQLTRSYAVSTLANLMRTVGAVVAVWIWPGALTPILVLVLATVLQFLVLVPVAASCAPDLRLRQVRATRASIRALVKISIPLWMSSGSFILASQVDRLVVSGWFGLAAVGRYAVAVDLASRLWILPNILGKAYFPRLARELASDAPTAYERTVRTYGAVALAASTVPAVPLAISGISVLSAWTARDDLGDAGTIFALILAGVVSNCSASAAFTVLQIKVQLRALAFPYFVFFLMHVAGCVLLPRLMGPVGAALSWALAHTVVAVLLHIHVWLRYRLRLLNDVARVLSAAALVGGAMLMIAWRLPQPPVNIHAPALARLVPVAGYAALWCMLGSVAVVAALAAGRPALLATIVRRERPSTDPQPTQPRSRLE